MGSPITFSGFNDIDFNVVLNGLMQQASAPLVALQAKQSALKTQGSTFTTLSDRVDAVRRAARDLSDPATLTALSATSSNANVLSVSSGSPASAGQYDVVVNALARAQVTASTSVAPDANSTVVASGGSLTIAGVEVTIAGDVTLQQLADAINATDGLAVQAAVVRTAPNSYRLTLTSELTGQANAFTVSNALSGGIGVTFADTDGNGLSGDSPEDNALNAADAEILINNIPVTHTSNTFNDVIPGVTFTAWATTPDSAVQIQVAQNPDAFSEKVEGFVKAYNDLVAFIGEQRAAANDGKTSIGRDPVVRQLQTAIRGALLSPRGDGSQDFSRLSEVGIEFDRTGTLTLNRTKFNAALNDNEDGVRQLFAGTGGAFPAVADLLGSYSASNGFLASVKTQVERQVKTMDTQIEAMQARLALQREALARQFTEADVAISRLRNQSSSLGTFGNNFGGL